MVYMVDDNKNLVGMKTVKYSSDFILDIDVGESVLLTGMSYSRTIKSIVLNCNHSGTYLLHKVVNTDNAWVSSDDITGDDSEMYISSYIQTGISIRLYTLLVLKFTLSGRVSYVTKLSYLITRLS